MNKEISISFVLIALAVSLLWVGVLGVVKAIGTLTMRYNLPGYVLFWAFVVIFLGVLLGLCINYSGGVR
jgi:hypothetical protein